MGNITSLTRDGFGTNNYTGYNGNKLTAISGFTNSTYNYDVNGNLTNDSQKNISLGYNFLNLPQTVSGSQNLTYTYNAAGEKLQKQAGGTTTNYIDGIQYTNNSIDFIQTEEGLARRSGNNYSYEYNLSDHLGNVRVTFYQNPTTNQLEVLQRDDYYAFGLRKEPVAKAGLNKYLYNGKELQEELGQYDYGARFYDPVIGRWNVIDPKAGLGRRWSPYNYGFDNPIYFVDPDGMWPGEGLFSYLVSKGTEYVKNAATNYVKKVIRYAKESVKETVKETKVSPYVKAEGKITLGARAAANLKNNVGVDVNAASAVILSGSAEIDAKGIQKEGYSSRNNPTKKSTSVGNFAAPVGAIEGLPISVAGGLTSEKTFVDGKLISSANSGSLAASVIGTPIGVFTSIEGVKDDTGTSNTVRVAPLSYGMAVGVGLVGEFNIDLGIKIKWRNEKK
ncbi:hypothetical protein OC25_07845 [Pedobacter kyungheensis]|uniref:RHS repeat-associated core domain-containing protein n=1 Tax=Pedobacter kyungheensis TaxID=1069985 RepID=A0A0C1DMG2_9SPHI|nr:RHS repeat-associated core domain-containing protein [Pedobacter kyungheensis]KIA95215.1 hypothetical protein OC25_07845 [Pedobacter kyungheensis]